MGEYFSTSTPGAMIVGFYGCSGMKLGLREIGVHMIRLNYDQIKYQTCRPKDLLLAGRLSLQIKLACLLVLQIKLKKAIWLLFGRTFF